MVKQIRKLYQCIGSPVNGKYMRWYKYLLPRRITLGKNPPIYCWLGFNFSWIDNDDSNSKYGV